MTLQEVGSDHLAAMVVDVYRECARRSSIFSPSINVDATRTPVKECTAQPVMSTHRAEESILF